MSVRVGPTEQRPNYHLKLSGTSNAGVASSLGLILCDGKGTPSSLGIRKTSYPRTVLKIGQGNSGWGDFEMPYTPIVQSDWGGGRGQEDFERDTTRYYDSHGVDATKGDIVLGPKATEGTGLSTNIIANDAAVTIDRDTDVPTMPVTADSIGWGESGWGPGVQSYGKVALQFTNVTAAVMKSVTFYAYSVGFKNTNLGGTITVELFADSGEAPTGSALVSNSATFRSSFARLTIPMTYSLTTSTRYWLVFTIGGGTSGGTGIYFLTGTTEKISAENLTPAWVELTSIHGTFLGKIVTAPNSKKQFFEYKGQLYAFESGIDNSVPKLWMNGYRGLATSNAADMSKTFTTASFTGIDLTGKVIKIVGGKGRGETIRWRVITGNTATGTNDSISVSPNWCTAQDTTTEYVILGCDTWQNITGTSSASSATNIKDMTTKVNQPVTDVLVVDDTVYIAQSGEQYLARIRLQTSGVWNDCASDGTNNADFMALICKTDGVRQIWTANQWDSTVGHADAVAWGNNLSLGSNVAGTFTAGAFIACGNKDVPITGMVAYGNPQIPWIRKSGRLGSISNDVYAEVPLGEMQAIDGDEPSAMLQHGVYLYFSMLDGLERYYDQRLDDVGPNRDEGLPTVRKGGISHLVGYPGKIFAAVDAGALGVSSILCHNGVGWHEIYRSSQSMRIQRMHVQIIPGDTVDRLWISEGFAINWIPITLNPRKMLGYKYQTGGSLVSSWIYGGLMDVVKFWKSVSIFAEANQGVVLEEADDDHNQLSTAHYYITLAYQIDKTSDAGAWISLATNYVTSPEQEIDLSATNSVNAKRWRYKLTLNTDNDTITPRVKALRVDSVTRVPPKNAWQITFLLEDGYTELDGVRSTTTAATVEAALASYADSDQYAAPLTMNSNQGLFDSKYVFVDPDSFQLVEASGAPAVSGSPTRKARAIGSFTVYEA